METVIFFFVVAAGAFVGYLLAEAIIWLFNRPSKGRDQ